MRILREDTAAILVDVQERLFPHIHDNETLIRNIRILVQGLQALDVPVIISEQYTKGLGFTVPELKELLPDHQPIEKISFSCCGCDEITEKVASLGRKNIILFGIETHVCVLQTALDLLESGYRPVLVEDCVSSRKAHDKAIAVERIRSEGALVTSYESLLFELCRVAGTDMFKIISKLVK